MGIIRYVRYDEDFIKNMPATLLAELIILDEPIPDNFQSYILENNPSFRKERSEVIGRSSKILQETWETRCRKKQIIKESIDDYLEFECEEDIGFIRKYPQFKPIIDHIELCDGDIDGLPTIERIPIDQYLAEN